DGNCEMSNLATSLQKCSRVIYHTRKLTPTTHYECMICSSNFHCYKKLVSHRKEVHKPERNRVCNFVQVILYFIQANSTYRSHIVFSLRKGILAEMDERKRILNINTTNVDKSHKCDVCGKFFFNKSYLKIHARPHWREAIPCPTCRRAFAFECQLHVHYHTGEKPFKCTICNKRYATAHTLKVHKLSVHEGQKPFSCNLCGKCFAQHHSLTSHLNRHLGEKTQKCGLCEKSKELRIHTKYHVGDRLSRVHFLPERICY
ncbi:putative zinc finger protein, partial [Orchesella cincta]